MAKLTLIGMYNYFDEFTDNDLFDNLTMPSGINIDDVKNTILLNGGEFETLYANPDFMRLAIGAWSSKWERTFNKWITALNIDYEPLNNYDRTETATDTDTGTINTENFQMSENNFSHETTNNINKNVSDNGIKTTTTENKRYSFNENDATPTDESTVTETPTLQTTEIGTENGTAEGSDTGHAEGNIQTTNDLTKTHTMRAYGNIGVTTSQQMLESELKIAKWNIYEKIADIFISEFCIMVY